MAGKEKFRIYWGDLPHWRCENYAYFVTWRVAKGQGPLTPDERGVVVQSLRFFDGKRYEVEAYVVMDDHVHVVVHPHESEKLEAIVHSWKSFTANRLQRVSHRSGKVWQPEYFDRLIRGEVEMREKMEYILRNPQKRWSDMISYSWVWCRGME
jgi:REP element-mobilizing transposase RayT